MCEHTIRLVIATSSSAAAATPPSHPLLQVLRVATRKKGKHKTRVKTNNGWTTKLLKNIDGFWLWQKIKGRDEKREDQNTRTVSSVQGTWAMAHLKYQDYFGIAHESTLERVCVCAGGP